MFTKESRAPYTKVTEVTTKTSRGKGQSPLTWNIRKEIPITLIHVRIFNNKFF